MFYYGERFEWWLGEIAEVSDERLLRRSIWECEGHYRRYLVKWTEFTDNMPEWMSPWELAATASGPRSAQIESRCEQTLDDVTHQTLIDVLARAKQRSEARYFRQTLTEQTSFLIAGRTRRDDRTLFYNQVVALPLSLKLITARLEMPTYYTSLEAFKFDVHLIVQNAQTFTEPNSSVSKQADALEAFIIHSVDAAAESSQSSSEEELICKDISFVSV